MEQQYTEEELATEVWRDVVGYENKSMVSNLGRIRIIAGEKTGIVKLPNSGANRYVFSRGCGGLSVHRVVAAAFIYNYNNGWVVNHLDGNRGNNRVENLEWCTQQENLIHAHKTGLVKKYSRRNNKPSERVVLKQKLSGTLVKKLRFRKSCSRMIFLEKTGLTPYQLSEAKRGYAMPSVAEAIKQYMQECSKTQTV